MVAGAPAQIVAVGDSAKKEVQLGVAQMNAIAILWLQRVIQQRRKCKTKEFVAARRSQQVAVGDSAKKEVKVGLNSLYYNDFSGCRG